MCQQTYNYRAAILNTIQFPDRTLSELALMEYFHTIDNVVVRSQSKTAGSMSYQSKTAGSDSYQSKTSRTQTNSTKTSLKLTEKKTNSISDTDK